PHDHAHDQSHACGADHHCDHGSMARHEPGHDAICLDNVSYTYPAPGDGSAARKPALRNVTLHVKAGCNLGIIGPNGAGKSTLVQIILGLLDGYSGSASIFGMTPEQACRKGDIVGYVPQRHQVEWRFPLSVVQVVQMGLCTKTGLLR